MAAIYNFYSKNIWKNCSLKDYKNFAISINYFFYVLIFVFEKILRSLASLIEPNNQ
jgi:hypothetical protein